MHNPRARAASAGESASVTRPTLSVLTDRTPQVGKIDAFRELDDALGSLKRDLGKSGTAVPAEAEAALTHALSALRTQFATVLTERDALSSSVEDVRTLLAEERRRHSPEPEPTTGPQNRRSSKVGFVEQATVIEPRPAAHSFSAAAFMAPASPSPKQLVTEGTQTSAPPTPREPVTAEMRSVFHPAPKPADPLPAPRRCVVCTRLVPCGHPGHYHYSPPTHGPGPADGNTGSTSGRTVSDLAARAALMGRRPASAPVPPRVPPIVALSCSDSPSQRAFAAQCMHGMLRGRVLQTPAFKYFATLKNTAAAAAAAEQEADAAAAQVNAKQAAALRRVPSAITQEEDLLGEVEEELIGGAESPAHDADQRRPGSHEGRIVYKLTAFPPPALQAPDAPPMWQKGVPSSRRIASPSPGRGDGGVGPQRSLVSDSAPSGRRSAAGSHTGRSSSTRHLDGPQPSGRKSPARAAPVSRRRRARSRSNAKSPARSARSRSPNPR